MEPEQYMDLWVILHYHFYCFVLSYVILYCIVSCHIIIHSTCSICIHNLLLQSASGHAPECGYSTSYRRNGKTVVLRRTSGPIQAKALPGPQKARILNTFWVQVGSFGGCLIGSFTFFLSSATSELRRSKKPHQEKTVPIHVGTWIW